MRRLNWQTVVKGIIGFLLGLAVWWGLTPAYDEFVAAVAQPLVRAAEHPAVTRLRASNREIIVDREDFPPRSGHPGLPADDLTFNFVLLAALFAAEPSALSTRNVTRFLIGTAVLAVTHILAFIATLESLYATQLGPWSLAHYNSLSRNFWSGGAHFYRIVGIYAVAFLAWWLLRPSEMDAAPQPSSGRGRRRKRR